MRFYKHPHAFYAGVDLHARSMFTHILDSAGAAVFERDLPANPANPDGDRGFRMRRSQPRLPTCRAGFELSRCVAVCRSRVLCGLDSAANAPGESTLSFGSRACRFAWPARGTERFLGRCVSKFPLRV